MLPYITRYTFSILCLLVRVFACVNVKAMSMPHATFHHVTATCQYFDGLEKLDSEPHDALDSHCNVKCNNICGKPAEFSARRINVSNPWQLILKVLNCLFSQ